MKNQSFLQMLLRPIAFLIYGLLALAALIWWIGPLIPWNDTRPLAPVSTRLYTLGGLLLFFGLMWLIGAWRRRRANKAMMKELRAGPSASDREAELLDQRFGEALQILEESARKSGKRSFFKRQQYMYEMPWYLFVGAPGSGKTTALLNAGLNFPLAGKMGQVSVKGVGGTRNCDWWFSDEAIFIDTAGRYALQQSDEAVDAAGWANFLALLKRARPLRPLNGVMLTINIQDLLQQSPADRREHAAKLRTRLQELHAQLGVRPPVYVLVTKCDLIAGFNESFGELNKEERDQVWGVSFPYDPRGQDSPVQEFGAEFAALEKRLRERLLDQMEREGEVLKRAAIFSFPQQFGGLKGLLGGFLEAVFDGGGTLEERSLLRGVYFTSGTQEGTPIDRVLGTLARTFGVDQQASSIASSRGKSFFLSRLLKEVVFAESELVGHNQKMAAQRRRRRTLALLLITTVSLALIVGWTLSFMRNKAYVAQVQARIPELQAQVDALPAPDRVDLGALPALLDQVLAAPQSGTFELERPPWLNTLGLYQGPTMAQAAQAGYRNLLSHVLLPRVQQRQEERLRASNRDNLELAYESLKGYLMLYEPEHYEAEALKSWITVDWNTSLLGTVGVEERAALDRHLEAALALLATANLPEENAKLVENVRELLIAFPLEYRIFSRLKRLQTGTTYPDFSVASAGGLNAVQVFERISGQPITKGVPGLFTRNAYLKSFRGSVAKATQLLEQEQIWVLNIERSDNDPKDRARRLTSGGKGSKEELEAKVRRLYLQEYINQWDRYLADVRLVRLDGIDSSLNVARLLAAPDSPIAAYMRGVVREVQLGVAVTDADAKVAALLDEKTKVAKQAASNSTGVDLVNLTAPEKPVKLLEAIVDDHFSNLIRLVDGQPAPIDDVVKLFGAIYAQLTAVDASQRGKTAPPPANNPGSASAVKLAASMQPEPIKSMLIALSDIDTNQSRRATMDNMAAELTPVADFCNHAIAGRYPFVPASKTDVLPDDFGQLFGAGGLMDSFFQKRLAGLVDTSVTPWTFKPQPDGSAQPGGAALADFQRAMNIREAFFSSGARTPAFKLDLRLLEMSDDVKEMTLDIDGQVLKFTSGNTVTQSISWPGAKQTSLIKLSMPGLPPQTFEGPWALFRMLQEFDTKPTNRRETLVVVFNVEGRQARMQLTSNSTINPMRMAELRNFRCPTAL